ncbi:hypothetical protein, partial [Streptomyces edwardsiae]
TYRRVQVKIRFRNQRGQTAKDSSPEKGTTPARGVAQDRPENCGVDVEVHDAVVGSQVAHTR